MDTSAAEWQVDSVLPLFRTPAQGSLLAAVFLAGPDADLSLERLSTLTGVPYSSVHREITRLLAAGLVVDARVGNVRRIRPNPDSVFFQPLSSLIERAYGPVPLLRAALAKLPGLTAAAVYGSWAARSLGVAGDPPGDVDVLVIGAPVQRHVFAACRSVEQRVGRPVNPTIVTEAEWMGQPSAFFDMVARSPRVALVGEWSELVRDAGAS